MHDKTEFLSRLFNQIISDKTVYYDRDNRDAEHFGVITEVLLNP